MNINELCEIPFESRDQNWENDFFKALSEGSIEVISPDPQVGPDNWPYLLAQTAAWTEAEPFQKVLHWLYTRGIGLVINPYKEFPDFVFTYGMLWSFKETGFFYKKIPDTANQVIEFSSDQIKHAGTPTTEFLPNYVRSILKEFFRDQGVHNPKMLLVSMDNINYDLAFSLESLGNPQESEHEGVAEAISWFLPPHYSILLVSEQGLLPFVEL